MRWTEMAQADSTGFYIAASDRDLLAKVTDLLKRKGGMVGVVDTAGRVHFLVDGRSNLYRATENIMSVADQIESFDARRPEHTPEQIDRAVNAVLQAFGIPESLKGCLYLRYILTRLAKQPELVTPVSKTLYPDVARLYAVKVHQIDRVIRYATQQAGRAESNCKLIAAMNRQLQETLEREHPAIGVERPVNR